MDEIITWLEAGEPDYDAGIALLRQHSRNRSLLNVLSGKDSLNNREKLRYELTKVAAGHDPETLHEALKAMAAPAAEAPTTAPAPEPELSEVPQELRDQAAELTEAMQRVYNDGIKLSNTLADLPEAEGPARVAEILDNEKQYNALSEKRRRILAGQAEPAVEAEAAPALIDRGDLLQKRQNLRSNISKAKASAGKAKSADKKSEYEQKAAKLGVELEQVELLLKAQPAAPVE